MQKTEHIKRAVDAAIKTLVVPVPVPVATPTITAPSLPKLKALSTRKLAFDAVQWALKHANGDEPEPTITEGKKVPEQVITTFFRTNPRPEDANVHELAGAYGTDPHTLEEQVYGLFGDKLKTSATKVAEPPPPEGVNVKDWDRILQQSPKTKLRTIPGGKADGKPVGKYDKEQLGKGMKVEREHTKDPRRAEEISTDHLEEFPTYYTALDEMEKRLSEGKTAGYRLGVRNAIRLVANMY